MKKLLLLLSIVTMRQTHGQTYVTIPDANFVSWLQTNIPSAMSGNQMDTTNIAVTTTTHTIDVVGKNISNLYGIQYFSSLDTLYCLNNYLTTFTRFPNSLVYLNCSNNTLTNLPTLPNSLSHLECGINYLTSLPPLPNSITYLDCGNNSLSNIPTLPNSLTFINFSINHLTSLPTLPSSLQTFYCGSNPHLTNLPLLPNTLIKLACDHDSLTALPTLPNSLQVLWCYNNFLTTLPTLPNSLTNVECEYNNITCFPPFPSSITLLYININPFNCLPNYINAMNGDTSLYPLCAPGNSNGCPTAGINQTSFDNNEFKIYPNPTSDQFYIETNATDKINVDLYDVNGRHVYSASVSDKSNISVATLDNGVYTMTIKTVDRVINKKLAIVR